MQTICRFHQQRAARGFAYLTLLIAIAIIGVAAAATLELGSILQRRAAEEELLAIGSEFRRALISYASATPAGQLTAPPTLDALLKDPRYPNIRRHLRKLYYDPMTGSAQWGIVKTIDGNGIAGIYSLSTAKPIKVGNFEQQFLSLADKTSYSQWVFMAVMPVVPQQNINNTNGNANGSANSNVSGNTSGNNAIPNTLPTVQPVQQAQP